MIPVPTLFVYMYLVSLYSVLCILCDDDGCAGWLGGIVVRSRTSDSEVAGSSPSRNAVE